MLDVPDRALDGVYARRIVATWFGEPVGIPAPPDEATGSIELIYERHPNFAAATRMGGNQYSTWSTRVDPTELEDIQVIERPLRMRDDT